jgi:hypothetical protein
MAQYSLESPPLQARSWGSPIVGKRLERAERLSRQTSMGSSTRGVSVNPPAHSKGSEAPELTAASLGSFAYKIGVATYSTFPYERHPNLQSSPAYMQHAHVKSINFKLDFRVCMHHLR